MLPQQNVETLKCVSFDSEGQLHHRDLDLTPQKKSMQRGECGFGICTNRHSICASEKSLTDCKMKDSKRVSVVGIISVDYYRASN